MASRANNSTHTVSIKESFNDQYFLLNFIMSTYLGPDVYSDNPRHSASQRLAERLPPYTSKNLGISFVSFPQLESLYYYVLRNAHPGLVVTPSMLHKYLKGIMPSRSSENPEGCRQFTSFFPMSVHGHKKYSGHYEVVKGIVLIDDPVTSFMKTEDLKRFRYLSGMDDLKIYKIKSLCHEHGYQKYQQEEEQDCMKYSKEIAAAGNISKRNHNSSEKCRETYSAFQKTSKVDGPAMMPLLTIPNINGCVSDVSITLTGTAAKGIVGPPIGIVDIGISRPAYFFRVALPGVRRDYRNFSCEIEPDGKVHSQGSTLGRKTVRKRSQVFHMKLQQICPPGQFTLTFSLPGPVDPRLFSPNFRSDGIFEAIVIKQSNA